MPRDQDTPLAEDTRGGVNSVEVAGLLLRLLAEAGGPMRLADLSRAAAMPSAKAHRYLVSLVRAGLVEQDPATSRYELGPLMLRAGLAALGRSDLLKRAERALEAIVGRTGETAAAAVWGTHGPTHVRLVAARHALAASVPPGHVCPMTYSASGLVFCAFGEPARPRLSPSARWRRAAPLPGRAPRPMPRRWSGSSPRCAGRALPRRRMRAIPALPPSPCRSSIRGRRIRLALTVFSRVGRLNVAPNGPVVALMRAVAADLAAELHGGSR